MLTGRVDPCEPESSRLASSSEAEEGKSILRTRMPYGLSRVRQSSISFCFQFAAGEVSDDPTNRLLKRRRGAVVAGHARAAVRTREPAHRLPRQQKPFQQALFDQVQWRGRNASRSTS